MHILFHQQAVCKRGVKTIKTSYLMKMRTTYSKAILDSETVSTVFSTSMNRAKIKHVLTDQISETKRDRDGL